MLTREARNALVERYNPPERRPWSDDKILTAALGAAHGIAMPSVLGVIEAADRIDGALAGHDSFVVKPAKGAGGAGIVVVTGRTEKGFVRSTGVIMPFAEMDYHLGNILSGLYSKGGEADRVLVQQCVTPDPFYAALACGVADVRVLVFQNNPVMAMLRLPTRESGGKGNLHAGAVGVGIDLATGCTTHGVYRNGPVEAHPDTGRALAGVILPDWDAMLRLAVSAAAACGLGYVGVDLVVDAGLGPLVLELNAVPGLGIQLANRTSLKTVLNDSH